MCSNMWITYMSISFTHARSTREDGITCQTTLLKDIGYVAYCNLGRLVLNMLFLIYSIEMHQSSIAEYEWPNGSHWAKAKAKTD
jgi:hypothetical protein